MCIVGGVGVGKNYLMTRSGLPIVGRVTSRPKRPDDDPEIYSYFTNDEMVTMIEKGDLVQYAVDIDNSVIYGSTPDDYVKNGATLADIWHWSVDGLKNKGFGSVKSVSVITPWDQWRNQLEERFSGRDKSYRRARIAEAKKSLRWSRQRIEGNDPTHIVIINRSSDTEKSIQTLRDFANGKSIKTPDEATCIIDSLLDELKIF
jgi:guanylate kinase